MRLGKDAKIELLKNVPLFSGCTKKELRELASRTDEIDLRDGYVLMSAGCLDPAALRSTERVRVPDSG